LLLRQLRGALGITLLWAVVWFPLGIGLGVWRYLRSPFSDEMYGGEFARLPALSVIGPIVLVWTAWGAISGFLFATILSAAERRHSVDDVSIVRVSTWGAIGSASLPCVVLLFVAREEGWSWWLLIPVVVAA
jgi:hypothetical protein